jgi:hypothetical protein
VERLPEAFVLPTAPSAGPTYKESEPSLMEFLRVFEKKIDAYEIQSTERSKTYYREALTDILITSKPLVRVLGQGALVRQAQVMKRLRDALEDVWERETRALVTRCEKAEKFAAKCERERVKAEEMKGRYKDMYEREIEERNRTYERIPVLQGVINEFLRMGGKLARDEATAKRWFEIRY